MIILLLFHESKQCFLLVEMRESKTHASSQESQPCNDHIAHDLCVCVCLCVMCKCLPMGFLRLNVVLTGDVIAIKTHAPAPTLTTHHCARQKNNGRIHSVVFLEALLI